MSTIHNVLYFKKASDNKTALEVKALKGTKTSIDFEEIKDAINDGYIEPLYIPGTNFLFIVDEEGERKKLSPTVSLMNQSNEIIEALSGNCLIVKMNGSEMVGLTDKEIQRLQSHCGYSILDNQREIRQVITFSFNAFA